MSAFDRGLGIRKPHFHKNKGGHWTWAIVHQGRWPAQECTDWCRRMNKAAK